MRAAALFLWAGLMAAPAQAGAAQGAAAWDRVIELYRPGGLLNERLEADIESKEPPAFLNGILSDPALTPMGAAAGSRWFRDRLKALRGPKPAKREGLVGWVVEKSVVLEWRSVPTGAQ